jgi:hypothetical protein
LIVLQKRRPKMFLKYAQYIREEFEKAMSVNIPEKKSDIMLWFDFSAGMACGRLLKEAADGNPES